MRKFIFVAAVILAINGCKEKYSPDINYPDTGYMLVEGFINSAEGETRIKLSRTVKLTDTASIRYENGANVRIEGDDNSSYQLTQVEDGLYTVNKEALNSAVKYRLHINTFEGKEYVSDYSSVIRTPPIDSISWVRNEKGAQLFINAFDPTNKTKYYNWDYEETWEFRSFDVPTIKYYYGPSGIDSVGYIFPDGMRDYSKYNCWQSNISTTIMTGSTVKLAEDKLMMPLLTIEPRSWKLSVLYSVKTNMHGVSALGYEFLQRMKKNSESVGSIFDAQPSELNGNIKSISDPNEIVLGYVDVADLQENRKFISNVEVPGWGYSVYCPEQVIPNIPDTLRWYQAFAPVRYTDEFKVAVVLNEPECIDCTIRGSNVKPPFWP